MNCEFGFKTKLVFITIIGLSLFTLSILAEYVPGDVLLKFKPIITQSITAEVNLERMREIGLSKVSELNTRCNVQISPKLENVLRAIGVLHLKFPPETDITKIIEKYRADPDIEYAEPNYIYHIFTTTPNDPYYTSAQQWGLTKICANYAWDVTTGNTTVIVAVLDTGVDTDHPDLVANLKLPGQDVVNGDSDPNDGQGHGTHVAGIIAAVTNNNTGVAGVSWYSKILPVKVMNDDVEASGSVAQVVAGIEWAVSQNADVLNLSLGDPAYSSTLQLAVDNARANGCVVIAAAGNKGTTEKNYPAACNGVIAVGATDSNDNRASFSNYGDWITVVAPGTGIWSTYPNHSHSRYPSTYNYASLNGTSMATPFVSGVAALIFARFPGISNIDVELRIKRGIDDLGSSGKDSIFGYGRINAVKAVGDYLTEIDPIKIYVYPNPLRFPESTKITIKNIPVVSKLSVKIYNIAGELVREFKEDEIQVHANPDYAYIDWDGRNNYDVKVASGVYIAVVSDGTRVAIEKIMLIK